MKLTDADRSAIQAALKGFGDIHCHVIDAYVAGKRAGREDTRERAAKALAQVYDSDRPYDERTIDACLTIIRALGVDDE